MPLPPSIAYHRFLRIVERLEGGPLPADDADALRAAADARLFGDEGPEGILADADVRLLALEVTGALSNDQVEVLERRLHAIAPAVAAPLAA
jgi:hypothetical protein